MKDKILGLSYYERLHFGAMSIKVITGMFGAQMILDGKHPYLTILVLAIGGVANEYLSTLKLKESKNKKGGNLSD